MNQRPVNLNLFTIKFPITAIASILHRVCGVILFVSLPFWLWALQFSLESEADFAKLQDCFSHVSVRFAVWVSLSALAYHFVAGVRHILMDMGYGESKKGGCFGAKLVFFIAILLSLLLGWWIW